MIFYFYQNKIKKIYINYKISMIIILNLKDILYIKFLFKDQVIIKL